MSEEREVMVEASLQAMSDAFGKAKETLTNTQSTMGKIADSMDQGALQGSGGSKFVDAIKSKLNPKLGKLMDKMQTEHDNVKKAIDRIHQAESSAKSPFGG